MNCWRMVRILLATWNVDFALVDERETNKMQEEPNELGAMISKLQLDDVRGQSRLTFKWKGKKLLS